jgi:uncharacterized protein (DUF302 family)
MANKFAATVVAVWICGGYAMAADGMTSMASRFSPAETVERLEAEIRARGMTVFARIDHAAGAKEAGLTLRPTVVVIFGNARAGTPLMQANQEIGIDLPLKALVWQDTAGKTWLAYSDPAWLVKRHGLGADADADRIVDAITAALGAVAKKATGSD